ncbi:MAG: hypothetical protein AABW50_05370 [Nanoarchaeota archaeon]
MEESELIKLIAEKCTPELIIDFRVFIERHPYIYDLIRSYSPGKSEEIFDKAYEIAEKSGQIV